jgi:hypothetical protein
MRRAPTSLREYRYDSRKPTVPKGGPRRPLQAVPRFALTREEAAASLGMSVSHFERNVQPDHARRP